MEESQQPAVKFMNIDILNSSIKNFQTILSPEIRKAKSKTYTEPYMPAIKKHERLKNSIITEKKIQEKFKPNGKKSNSILEYEFVQSHEDQIKQDKVQASKYKEMIPKTSYDKLHDRRVEYQRNKDMIKRRLLEEECKNIKRTPEISNHSKKIIQEKLYNEPPLHLRAEAIIEKKKTRIELLKKTIDDENENDPSKSRTFNNSSLLQKSKSFDAEQFDDWVKLNDVWLHNKQLKIEYIKKDLTREEMDNDIYTFSPKINRNSSKIALRKSPSLPRFETLYKNHEKSQKKISQIQIKKLFSFTPVINKSPALISAHRNKVFGNSKDLSNSKIVQINYEESNGKLNKRSLSSNNIMNKSIDKTPKSTVDTKSKNTLNTSTSKKSKHKNKSISIDKNTNAHQLYKLNTNGLSSWNNMNVIGNSHVARSILRITEQYGK